MLRYFLTVVRHKWWVFRAGLKIGCPIWRLVTHDLSKFSPREFPYYARWFGGRHDRPAQYMTAWLRHQNRNDHHWEWWIPRAGSEAAGYPDMAAIPMSRGAVHELVADWLGACRSYQGRWPTSKSDWPWWLSSSHKVRVTPGTQMIIDHLLDLFFNGEAS